MARITYDPKCEELARFFLNEDGGREIDEGEARGLAQAIQQAIEDYLHGKPAPAA